MLPPPDCFIRPLNIAQYARKVLDMDDMDLMRDAGEMPGMAPILTTHDIRSEEWNGFMRDLLDAWLGRLLLPESAKDVRRSVVVTDLVEHWNLSFFAPRGVELIVYKGYVRRTGRYAGRIDSDPPGVELTASDFTDSGDEAEGDYVPPGGVRRERRERRERERAPRRRAGELERKYTMYLTCLRPPALGTEY